MDLRIQIDVDAGGQYRFRVSAGTREFTTAVDPHLATSLHEDLRLLRWKSVGARDPGDVLLNDVGERLAALIASPEQWNELGLANEARQVRVQFAQAVHPLMPFPWELLRVDDTFLIGAPGSHLVRYVPATAARSKRRNPLVDIVHMSLGSDNGLRFDEERCRLLETVPTGIPMEFLIDPSPGHVEAVLDGFRPQIVVISGHGRYDDLKVNTISSLATVGAPGQHSLSGCALPMGASFSSFRRARALVSVDLWSMRGRYSLRISSRSRSPWIQQPPRTASPVCSVNWFGVEPLRRR
jgi:hypothetical protein